MNNSIWSEIIRDRQKRKKYSALFRLSEVPAKRVLLREGEISQHVYIIESGCIRGWYNHDGKDITCQFFFEKNMVASIMSFRKDEPSLFTLETLEPSRLWVIEKNDANRILHEMSEDPHLREMILDAIFERSFTLMKSNLSFLKDSPTTRYLALMKENPKIIERVPQHYIASYLGISSVHLSRLRNKIARGES